MTHKPQSNAGPAMPFVRIDPQTLMDNYLKLQQALQLIAVTLGDDEAAAARMRKIAREALNI